LLLLNRPILSQRHNPTSHTIIEAHPDVYAHMLKLGWDKRPGVRILFGRWQDVLPQLHSYDGIFFDTYGEYYEELRNFNLQLPKLLKPSGVYSFFNGLASDNFFFHMVYGR
jgi:protein arginine N-methyltransferase 2